MDTPACAADMDTCRRCHLHIERIAGTWTVMDTGTTADGLTYCPPNPDHAGRLGTHIPMKVTNRNPEMRTDHA